MKIKTITAVLCKKFDEFAASIQDEEVRELVKKGSIITGGCIASMLLREPVNDYDLYFVDKETTKRVAAYFVGKFNETNKYGSEAEVQLVNPSGQIGDGDRIRIFIKSSGVAGEAPEQVESHDLETADNLPAAVLEEAEKYKPTFLSSNAITLSGHIQLVIRFYGQPEQIHENYDFVHCMNYWTSWDRKVVTRPDALESLLTKELRYIGSKYPICSVIRTRKFISRQWTINAGQYLKMCLQISKLNLEDLNVLEDQLVGVDATYFNNVIYALKEKNTESVDASYLVTLIDRIF
jgi:hypothetical protein